MPRLIEDGYDAALFYGDLLPKVIGIPLRPAQHYLVVGSRISGRTRYAGAPERAEPPRLSWLSPHRTITIAGPLPPMATCAEIEVTGPLTTSTPALYLGAAEARAGAGLLSGRGGESKGRGGNCSPCWSPGAPPLPVSISSIPVGISWAAACAS